MKVSFIYNMKGEDRNVQNKVTGMGKYTTLNIYQHIIYANHYTVIDIQKQYNCVILNIKVKRSMAKYEYYGSIFCFRLFLLLDLCRK